LVFQLYASGAGAVGVRVLSAPLNWMRESLARKLVAAVFLNCCLVTGLLAWLLVGQEAAALRQQRVERAEGVASILAASAASRLAVHDQAGLRELTAAATSMNGERFAMILDRDGRVLAHSDARLVGKRAADRAAKALLAGPARSRLIASTSESLDAAAPIIVEGRPAGWTWVSFTLGAVHTKLRETVMAAIAVGSVALLLALIVTLALAGRVTRRVEGLANVLDRFGAGERGVRVPIRGRDEIAAASRGLNTMLEAVTETERSLTQVQAFAGLGSIRFEEGSTHLDCSSEMLALLGMNAQAGSIYVGRLLKALPADQRTGILAIAREGKPVVSNRTCTVRRADGSERVCWVQIRAERSAGGRSIILGIVQDATEREAAAAQLRQAQKMEAVGQLTGGLAHDFNNLLAVAIGNLDIANEDLPSGTLAKEAVEEALQAILRGSSLTKQLLAFSRQQPLSSKSVDVNALIRRFEPLCGRTVGGRIAVRTRLARDLPPTKVDPSQLESALLNLLINARDAMSDGGTVTIETACAQIDSSMVDGPFSEITPGRYSVLTVSDTGEGMTPEVRERACEPFFTTKSVGAGSGLGLSMIYGFAKQSDGHLKIYSEIGRGTAVRLYLPASTAPADPEGQEFALEEMPLAGGETVLVVEDDEEVRRVVQRQLRELGYMVLSAANGQEALRRLEDHRVDLLFTDIVMPGGLTGVELGARAGEARPDLRILYTSGFTRAGASELPEDASLLTKPYRKRDLAVRVRDALDSPRLQPAGAEL
jgi:signal transduction histidine kinase/HAMP domain-containing protein